MKFNEKLKQARENSKMTQVELADKVNVSQGTIANWERGHRAPDIEMVPTLAAALGVNVNYFFDVEEASNSIRKLLAEPSQSHIIKAPIDISDDLEVISAFVERAKKEAALANDQNGSDDVPVIKSESEWMQVLSQMSDESLVQLRDYTRYLLWKQSQVYANSK